jgi:hypothetical protein
MAISYIQSRDSNKGIKLMPHDDDSKLTSMAWVELDIEVNMQRHLCTLTSS